MPHAGLGDLQILGEVEAEDFERNPQIQAGIGIGDEIDHQVGVGYEGIQIPVGGADVLMVEYQIGMIEELGDLFTFQVDRCYLVAFVQQPESQVRADEATRTQG